MEQINIILSGYVMPLLLMGTGIFLGAKMKFFYIFHPKKYLRELRSGGRGGGISPLRALSQALAGTLGVGNMTGVATAICAGGAGAVFWMWISAALAMSVKYFEVALAVKCRRQDKDGYTGGAMYYIRDVLSPRFPRAASVLSFVFSLLLIVNSLLSGNIVQMNSAAGALPFIHPLIIGGACAVLALICALGKRGAVSAVTFSLIPPLSLLYVFLSLIIIIPRARLLPSVLSEIFCGAFSLRSAGGGIGGFILARALRFGTARGVFSNEAGSGTSPTAHGEANAKSPHAQGCLGVFEVFADTIVLCTLTALVILLSDGTKKGYKGIALTLYAFSSQAGELSGRLMGILVILFAFATVISQTRYGAVALRSISKRRSLYYFYLALCFGATVIGTVAGEGAMWQLQDTVVSLMTAINTLCLLFAARQGYLEKVLE